MNVGFHQRVVLRQRIDGGDRFRSAFGVYQNGSAGQYFIIIIGGLQTQFVIAVLKEEVLIQFHLFVNVNNIVIEANIFEVRFREIGGEVNHVIHLVFIVLILQKVRQNFLL